MDIFKNYLDILIEVFNLQDFTLSDLMQCLRYSCLLVIIILILVIVISLIDKLFTRDDSFNNILISCCSKFLIGTVICLIVVEIIDRVIIR